MQPVYFDTSIFIELGSKKSKLVANLTALLKELQANRVRIYTSILTVQEVSVSSYRKGAIARDTMADLRKFARVSSITKEIALTAAKREAEVLDLEGSQANASTLSEEQKLERICANRRRKWDCLHIATAQILECGVLYSTDRGMQQRPAQLGIRNLSIIPPQPPSQMTIDSLLV